MVQATRREFGGRRRSGGLQPELAEIKLMDDTEIIEIKRQLRVLEGRIADLLFMAKRLGDTHPLVGEAAGEIQRLCRIIGRE